MTSGFSADLAAARATRPDDSVVAVIEPEREAEVEPVATVAAEAPPPPAARLEKISTAVRLTRQALDAWASVIGPTSERENADPSADAF